MQHWSFKYIYLAYNSKKYNDVKRLSTIVVFCVRLCSSGSPQTLFLSSHSWFCLCLLTTSVRNLRSCLSATMLSQLWALEQWQQMELRQADRGCDDPPLILQVVFKFSCSGWLRFIHCVLMSKETNFHPLQQSLQLFYDAIGLYL